MTLVENVTVSGVRPDVGDTENEFEVGVTPGNGIEHLKEVVHQ